MNAWTIASAVAMVRGWTWLYTLPLNETIQTRRRAEIASDVWEFEHDRSERGDDVWPALHLLIRTALGMADDLLWACEQIPHRASTLRPSALGASGAFKFACGVVAASGFVVSVMGAPLDPAQTLRLDVASTGWVAYPDAAVHPMRAPAVAFTLTNVGRRPMGAIQVNALFYGPGPRARGLGSAYSTVVGARGLAAGATSRAVVVQAGLWRPDLAGMGSRGGALQSGIPDSRVKLFVRHEGRWTLLADLGIRAVELRP